MARRFVRLLVLGLAVATSARAAEVPVVVAVDASRSLTTTEMKAAVTAIDHAVQTLPADTPMGLLRFSDQPRWMVPVGGTRTAVAEALAQLRPEGRWTALDDALVMAARALPDGGVILLITDGRDENSATTPEDVAPLAATNDVRVVAASVGRRVDARALRRLALLTGGAYAGPLNAAGAAELTAELADARAAVAETRAAAAPPTPAPMATPVPSAPAPASVAPGIPTWVLALAAAALLVLALAVVLLVRRRQPTPVRTCERCGTVLEDWEETCPRCAAGLEEAEQRPVATIVAEDESVLDPEVFTKSPLPGGLEHTLVLDERPLLVVKERGRPPRTYTLPRDEIFAVGRAADVNTLQVDDPATSAQHFRIVPKDEEFYVVDLETTNGTTVNGNRVRVHKLHSGEVIRAGTVDYEYKLSLRRVG